MRLACSVSCNDSRSLRSSLVCVLIFSPIPKDCNSASVHCSLPENISSVLSVGSPSTIFPDNTQNAWLEDLGWHSCANDESGEILNSDNINNLRSAMERYRKRYRAADTRSSRCFSCKGFG